ncbi:MAG: hypothetical protein Q4A94_02840 [Plesiomonas sp.]|nr:hypothetical protein [Plesiomonas sp.]
MQTWRSGLTAAMVLWSGIMVPTYAQDSARMFPIWGEEAKAAGYEIPEPFGLNISHMQVKQGIQVDSISFSGLQSGLNLGSLPVGGGLGSVMSPQGQLGLTLNPVVRETRQRSDTTTLRADMWVFPFLNLYGLVGKTSGRTDSMLDMNVGLQGNAGVSVHQPKVVADHLTPLLCSKLNVDCSKPFTEKLVHGAITQALKKNPDLSLPIAADFKLTDIHFPLEFHGDTFGLGFVLAGGYGNWFALTDVSYTQTKMDILDGKIDALVASPRVGYQFSVLDRPLRIWAGGMYQSIDQSFSGNIADLALPANLKQMLLLVDPSKSGKFHVEQHLESPWNTLLGAQYQITPNLLLLTEWGLGKRTSAFFTLDMRF